MGAREIARARATAIALRACVEQLSLRLVECSEDDRQYLWGELSETWQMLATVALNTCPSVDETNPSVTAEVELYWHQPREDPIYPADNVIECLMALTQQSDLQAGGVRTVTITIGGQQ